MMMNIFQRCLLAGVLIAGAVCGCNRNQALGHVPDPAKNYPPAYGDTLIEGTIADPAILNPILASDSASFEVTGLVFNQLIRYDKDLNFEAELAEKWEVSPDGKVITFHLRKGVRWQDGQPLTAKDVLFSYQTYINPMVKTAYRSNYNTIARAETPDNYTFRVYYHEPFAPALQSLAAMAILPEHLLKNKDINTADDFNTHPIGTGPFRFKQWKHAESISLEANPDYFEGKPRISRVVYRVIPDMSVQFLELQNGALDMMGLTPNQFNREGDQPAFAKRFNKYRYASPQYTYLGFNLKNPLFQDIRVRRAWPWPSTGKPWWTVSWKGWEPSGQVPTPLFRGPLIPRSSPCRLTPRAVKNYSGKPGSPIHLRAGC